LTIGDKPAPETYQPEGLPILLLERLIGISRIQDVLRAALGPAFVPQRRDLTPEGLTKLEYVGLSGDAGPGRVIVVIPAHNEAELIGEALESLAAQTRVPDEVLVVTDRCSDLTGRVAAAHGATARITVQNRDNKAGALNQALAYLLPRLSDNDAVLMMDADTSLSPDFISEATWRLREPKGERAQVGAVGGVFLGYPLRGFLAHLQNNEYVRYAREIGRRKGRADVLTGTATLFSAKALRAVERARSSGQLPPGTGIYGIDALTEDNELTLALKHVGYRCVSPKACTAGTELMPTAGRLFHQRLRWQRGALQNLLEYGVTRHTLPYMLRQLMTYVGVAFVPFFFTTFILAWMQTGSVRWSWFWIFVTGFVVAERVWSVKRGGWRSLLLAGLVLPEVIYDLFLHVVYIKALTDIATHERETWEHIKRAEVMGTRSWRQRWKRIAGPLYSILLLAAVITLAFICVVIGIAWSVIAGLVLAGAALSALRFSGLDPFGLPQGTGEPATLRHSADAPNHHGFGGGDVPADAFATAGGEGTHHWLSGGAGDRNPRVTSSAAARRSRRATTAWLNARRQEEQLAFSLGGRIGASA
jgi:cellulose synthase/poly-beta-1,6-N-acetylglucosamine synthase-like glycosyltransferase